MAHVAPEALSGDDDFGQAQEHGPSFFLELLVNFFLTVMRGQGIIDAMTKNTLPNTIEMAANELGHRAEFAARTGQPLPVIRLADGREIAVRGAMFGCCKTTLLYVAGPSDTYRHDYKVDVVAEDPCANCGTNLADHDRNDLSTCQTEHLHHLAGRQ